MRTTWRLIFSAMNDSWNDKKGGQVRRRGRGRDDVDKSVEQKGKKERSKSEASPFFFSRPVNRVPSSRETNWLLDNSCDNSHANYCQEVCTWTRFARSFFLFDRCKSVKGRKAVYCFLTFVLIGWMMICYIVCVASHGACLALAMIMGATFSFRIQKDAVRVSHAQSETRGRLTGVRGGKEKKARWEGRKEEKKRRKE